MYNNLGCKWWVVLTYLISYITMVTHVFASVVSGRSVSLWWVMCLRVGSAGALLAGCNGPNVHSVCRACCMGVQLYCLLRGVQWHDSPAWRIMIYCGCSDVSCPAINVAVSSCCPVADVCTLWCGRCAAPCLWPALITVWLHVMSRTTSPSHLSRASFYM